MTAFADPPAAWDDDDDQSPLGIGTIALYERLPAAGSRAKKKNPIGFVHFPDKTKRRKQGEAE